MNELFTLLNSKNSAESEATYWLDVFDELPDSMFQKIGNRPSALVIETVKQYGKVYAVVGKEGVVLN
jgi:putative heme iron utilization protein